MYNLTELEVRYLIASISTMRDFTICNDEYGNEDMLIVLENCLHILSVLEKSDVDIPEFSYREGDNEER